MYFFGSVTSKDWLMDVFDMAIVGGAGNTESKVRASKMSVESIAQLHNR
jgi:hypothetical protein